MQHNNRGRIINLPNQSLMIADKIGVVILRHKGPFKIVAAGSRINRVSSFSARIEGRVKARQLQL